VNQDSPEGAAGPKLHVYTGEGKGKTTACIGLCVRAVGAGMRVHLIQFDKGFDGTNEHYAERSVLRRLEGLTLDATGCERIQPDGRFRFGVTPADRAEAERALAIARAAVISGAPGLLVLDEILSAQQYHLITEHEILDLVTLWKAHPTCELVLSGRTHLQSILDAADLVTEMRKIKHYFDEGLMARRGIEF